MVSGGVSKDSGSGSVLDDELHIDTESTTPERNDFPVPDGLFKIVYNESTKTWSLTRPTVAELGGETDENKDKGILKAENAAREILSRGDNLVYEGISDQKSMNWFMREFFVKKKKFEQLVIQKCDNVTEVQDCPAKSVSFSENPALKKVRAVGAEKITFSKCNNLNDITVSKDAVIHFNADQKLPKTWNFSGVKAPIVLSFDDGTAIPDKLSITPPADGTKIKIEGSEAKVNEILSKMTPEMRTHFEIPRKPASVSGRDPGDSHTI